MLPPKPIALLSIVVPLYDEEAVLPSLIQRLNAMRATLDIESEIIFVNDGSRDGTSALLNRAAGASSALKVIHLARNLGVPKAVQAGLRLARGEAIVIMDGDLQDPPEMIPEMVERFSEGYEVVFGRRLSRARESSLKKLTSVLFCRLLNLFSRLKVPDGVGDFCLISRHVQLRVLAAKTPVLLRVAITLLEYPTAYVDFHRPARHAGQSKFTVARMGRLAFDSFGAARKPR